MFASGPSPKNAQQNNHLTRQVTKCSFSAGGESAWRTPALELEHRICCLAGHKAGVRDVQPIDDCTFGLAGQIENANKRGQCDHSSSHISDVLASHRRCTRDGANETGRRNELRRKPARRNPREGLPVEFREFLRFRQDLREVQLPELFDAENAEHVTSARQILGRDGSSVTKGNRTRSGNGVPWLVAGGGFEPPTFGL